MGVGDHHVHETVGRERVFPGESLVDAQGRAVVVQQEVLGPTRIAEMRSRQRLVRLKLRGGNRMRRHRLWIRRFEAEAAGTLDRAQQDLQQV